MPSNARRLRTALIGLVVLANVTWLTGPVSAQDKEQHVKVAFLYNFAKFTRWPETAFAGQAAFELCVIGNDPFGALLDALAQKSVGEHRVAIRRLMRPAEAAHCHMVFIAQDAVAAHDGVPDELVGPGVLLVGDSPGLASRGAIINLVTDANKVRFEVNIEAARRAGLVLDTQLLRLGRLVGDEPQANGEARQ